MILKQHVSILGLTMILCENAVFVFFYESTGSTKESYLA